MAKYTEIITQQFLEELSNKTSTEIAELLLQRDDIDTNIINLSRIVRKYRQKFGIVPNNEAIILDKKESSIMPREESLLLRSLMQKQKALMTQRQATVTWKFSSDSWEAIAVLGDIHAGADNTDIERIYREFELIAETPNMHCVQVGDLTNSEGSYTHRNRIEPEEESLAIQRKTVMEYFDIIKDKLLAFCIGNHDWRAIITEGYDIGEELATRIKGAYLGYAGLINIQFENAIIEESSIIKIIEDNKIVEKCVDIVKDLEYRFYIDHNGDGYSMHNPNHSQKRVLDKVPHLYLDGVFVGHIHDAVAFQYFPYGQKHAVLVRSGGFSNPQIRSEYEQRQDYIPREMATPVILLNPMQKKILLYPTLEDGIEALKFRNGVL